MNRWIASGVIKRGEPFSSGIPLPQLMTPDGTQPGWPSKMRLGDGDMKT